jgi:transposase
MFIRRVRGAKRQPMHPYRDAQAITLGVDTHKDVHVALALDEIGRHRDTLSVEANLAGYKRLVDWAEQFGPLKSTPK